MVCIQYEILLKMEGGQSYHLHHHCATGDFVRRNRSGTHRGESRALTYMWDLKGWSQWSMMVIIVLWYRERSDGWNQVLSCDNIEFKLIGVLLQRKWQSLTNQEVWISKFVSFHSKEVTNVGGEIFGIPFKHYTVHCIPSHFLGPALISFILLWQMLSQ